MSAADTRPAVLDRRRAVEVDVRDDLCGGREPFGRIMAAVQELGPDEVLVVRAPFEPKPLYAVLGGRGFAHWTERLGADDWRVWFHRHDASAEAEPDAATTLDVRGLEAPLPMLRVLEQLDTLTPGATLTVLHDRRPLFLYPQLDERGFHHVTDEPGPGLVRIVISRRRV